MKDIVKLRLISAWVLLMISLAFSSTVKAEGLINRDRVWYYNSGLINGNVVFKMQFGSDTVINGKTYTTFSTTATTYTYHDSSTNEWITKETGPGARFYLREEGSKVYIYNLTNLSGLRFLEEWPYEESECLLYDFSLKEDESYQSVASNLMQIRLTIEGIGSKELEGGLKLDYQTISCQIPWGDEWDRTPLELYAVEGIGFVSTHLSFTYATLVGPQTMISTGYQYYEPPYPYPFGNATLNRVTDLDGNIIFTPKMLGDSGIDDIRADQELKDNQIYNLMGLPVSNPQPGTIYILNGKKYIHQ